MTGDMNFREVLNGWPGPLTEGAAWSLHQPVEVHKPRQTSEVELDLDDPEAYYDELDRQVQLGEEQADNASAIEELAVLDPEDRQSQEDDYWWEQRYAAAYYTEYGQVSDTGK